MTIIKKIISQLRFTVEQGFGTLKRRYRFDRARYLGRIKTSWSSISTPWPSTSERPQLLLF